MSAIFHKVQIVCVIVVILLVSYAAGDAFDVSDSDKDGSLSRDEFAGYTAQLKGAMTSYLDARASDGNEVVPELSSSDFIAATINSLMMILVTEIGDKTFFIAAVLAMRHGRLVRAHCFR